MSEEDKETFKQARPYIIGAIALAFSLRLNLPERSDACFDKAEAFMAEFEKRNEI